MATVKRKIGTALLAAVLAASMSVTAFAAESYTVPDNAKGGMGTVPLRFTMVWKR